MRKMRPSRSFSTCPARRRSFAPWLRSIPAAQRRFESAIAIGGAATRIHIGELDDWTPAATCVALGAALARRGGDLLVTTYPGSYHAFDSPGGRVVQRLDVPNGMHPGEGVHVGPNPAARKAANASVRTFLRERLRRDDVEARR